MTTLRDGVQLLGTLNDRRFLPAWDKSTNRFEAIPVDDRGTCSLAQHPVYSDRSSPRKLFHRYQNEKGQFLAIRCPASLDEQEGLRTLNDNPPGSIGQVLAQMGAERRTAKPRGGVGGFDGVGKGGDW